MKKLVNIVVLFSLSLSSWGEISNITIERTLLEGAQAKFVLPIEKSKDLMIKEAWRSPSGITCSATVYRHEKDLGTGFFECISKEGYKAQISIDCSKNTSRSTASYLFFGLVGEKEDVGNFYVWCE